jgi:hypothetical protein
MFPNKNLKFFHLVHNLHKTFYLDPAQFPLYNIHRFFLMEIESKKDRQHV